MTNLLNGAKKHENSVKNASHAENVGNILDNVENVPFALRGATVKTILYFLFSFVAAAELTAALSFYTMSMGASMIIAAVFCGVLAFGFHALLHGILSDTAKGVVFGKKKESGAMSNEVTGNIILSIVLLAIAACSVFFVGKKGFTAYRATQFEKKQDEAKPKGGEVKGIDASMLTGKNGKIAAWKLEALTDLEKAKAKGVEATTAATTADREAYDTNTAQITDIVGASAFVLELLLALLAYSIATAKLAAVMDEIARRNGSPQPAQQVNNTTAQNTPSVTGPTNTQQVNEATPIATATTPTNEKKGITQRFNEYTVNDQNAITEKLKTDLERDMFYFSVDQIKAYLSRKNELITTVSDATTVTIKFHSPILTDEILTAVTPPIEPQTAAPITPKQIGFSDNRTPKNTAQTAVTPNEGRVIIKGFQRHNGEKTDKMAAVTAAVTTAVTDTKIGICKRCENEFERTVYNKKFCCEDCKILHWQEKNGKILRKGTAEKV